MSLRRNQQNGKEGINRGKRDKITKKQQQQQKKPHTHRKQWMKMAVLSPSLSAITLNVNGLNFPIKRQNGWIN